MPVTELNPVTRPEFLALFEPDTHEQIDTLLARPDVAGIVCFENLDLGSSSLGHRSALIYGPGCTTKALADVRDRHLGDVPSQFEYPVHYYEKPLRPVPLIAVRVPTPLQKLTDGESRVEVHAESVTGAIGALESAYPGLRDRLLDESGEVRRFVNVYVNNEDIRFLQQQATPLKAGDEISIIPAIAGG